MMTEGVKNRRMLPARRGINDDVMRGGREGEMQEEVVVRLENQSTHAQSNCLLSENN